MCSHRISAANRMLSLRLRDRPCAEGCSAEGLFRRILSAILDRGGFDLDITLEFLGERLVCDRHLLADALVRPVLPGSLDEDGVYAGFDRLAVVVLAVPDDIVLARRAGWLRRHEGRLALEGVLPGLI